LLFLILADKSTFPRKVAGMGYGSVGRPAKMWQPGSGFGKNLADVRRELCVASVLKRRETEKFPCRKNKWPLPFSG
jgi:hypothetical protein